MSQSLGGWRSAACITASQLAATADTRFISPSAHPLRPQFEESLISAKMEQAAEEDEPMAEDDRDDGEDFLLKDTGDDLDMR